jgi:glycosyltransferase involved in cell wall biosynthesis
LKIVLINKSETAGGASVAAKRLAVALSANGVDVKMLVSDGTSSGIVEALDQSFFRKSKAFLRMVGERLYFLPFERSAVERFSFSPANTGVDLSKHPDVLNADVIHLHWTNQGFLSLKGLQRLARLGKPIVWTLHDMWAFTGGCHYNGTCLEFTESCGNCPFMRKPHRHDLSSVQFIRKKQIYKDLNINVVTCSKWLRSLTLESTLLRQKPVHVVPNPIDTKQFSPRDKMACRRELNLPVDKKLLLFGAANINDPRKGMRFLMEALDMLFGNFPVLYDQVELVVFGKNNTGNTLPFPFKTTYLNYVKDINQLVTLYNAADAYVLPSLQDNLPNTVMESMACGTPVIGFRTGGVPEMYEHQKSGYLAEVKNALSLSNGIYETLFINDAQKMGDEARQRVLSNYSESVVANRYLEVYQKALELR